jgi:hypothetical protein
VPDEENDMPTPPLATRARRLAGAALLAVSLAALAQDEGGLYIADKQFAFERVAQRAIAANPNGQRFFVLAVPPQTAAMTRNATADLTALRGRVAAAGGVLLVCERDVKSGAIGGALATGVIAVRGFTPALGADQRYYPDEDPAMLPASNEALRRLRATCSS